MIKPLRISQVQQALNAFSSPNKLIGDDVSFTSVSTDTRTLVAGDLYVALSGENFNGLDFVTTAIAKDCCGVVVEKEIENLPVPQLVVDNAVHTYGILGRLNRDEFSGPLVSITGSCGKTTVKEMLVSVFSQLGSVHATEKNFNNHIGVPKTLLQLDSSHTHSVLELGASAVGEISYLAGLVNAQVALVTNIQPAHVEGFGSIEAIAAEKSEIYHGLAKGGCAVVNLDEPFSEEWLLTLATKQVVTFSCKNSQAMVFASDIRLNDAAAPSFLLHLPAGTYPVALNVLGRHNVANALAVAAICVALKVDAEMIVKGLEAFNAVAGRLVVVKGLANSCVLDDTYNANPGSVKAAIDVLAAQSGHTVLVLGDMAELGEDAVEQHAVIGRYAREKNIQQLFTVGRLAGATSLAFGEGARHFENKDALVKTLVSSIESSSTCNHDNAAAILVKGSRSSHMEDVVNAIKQEG